MEFTLFPTKITAEFFNPTNDITSGNLFVGTCSYKDKIYQFYLSRTERSIPTGEARVGIKKYNYSLNIVRPESVFEYVAKYKVEDYADLFVCLMNFACRFIDSNIISGIICKKIIELGYNEPLPYDINLLERVFTKSFKSSELMSRYLKATAFRNVTEVYIDKENNTLIYIYNYLHI